MVAITDIGSLLSWWESMGVFDYLLPFLLIFAVIYGILEGSKILSGNKGVNIVIGIVIGLLALRVGFVQRFFTEAFPRLGVGIAILLILLILTGLFIGPGKNLKVMAWIFIAVGIVIGVIVIAQSFGSFGWGGDWFEGDLAFWIISAVLIIGLIVVVVMGKAKDTGKWETAIGGVRDALTGD